LLGTVRHSTVGKHLREKIIKVVTCRIRKLPTFPETHSISPRIADKIEDFPEPTEPIIAVKLPFLMEMFISWMNVLGFTSDTVTAVDVDFSSAFRDHWKEPATIRTGSAYAGSLLIVSVTATASSASKKE
jgi:hypothetical protein